MAIISYKVGSVYCYDCVIALKKFIGSLDGVQSIEMDGEDKIDISYDTSSISEKKLMMIVGESVDKLGFKIERCR
jgi:copper chaperone CopZ